MSDSAVDKGFDYLLGELPEAERERLEEAMLLDDEVFEAVCVAETEAVDAYVRGELGGIREGRMEELLAISSRLRERAATGRALASAMEREKVEVIGAPPAPIRPSRIPGWATSLAAAIFLVVGGGWIVSQQQQLGELSSQLRSEEAARATLADRTARLEDRLEAESERSQRLARALGDALQSAEEVRDLTVVLGAEVTRGRDGMPARALAPEVDLVRLRMELEEPGHWRSYRVEVVGEGGLVWSETGLEASTVSGISRVEVGVPAVLLGGGHYTVRLLGRGDDREGYETAGYYELYLEPSPG